jgi:uncharacterized membrane protein YesL
MNLFKYDSAVSNILSKMWDFFILNIMWVICSLPLVTLGNATTAMYYSLIKMNRKEDYGTTKMFLHSFAQNLKQGCCLTIIFLLTGIVWYFGIQTYSTIGGLFGKIAMVVLSVALIIWGILFSYVFPLLAQFDNTIKNTIKNAFIISISNLDKTLIITVLNLIPLILFLEIPYIFVVSLPIWLLGGIVIIAFLNTKIFVRIFDKYIATSVEDAKISDIENMEM